MARVIWKGAISFSLIHIPVSLHPASRAASLDFTMLDKRDFSPVGYQRINKGSGKTVEWGDIVKGYEYEKGEYVVMSDEDFRQANVEATQTIDIQGFVEPGEIPPMYYDTPYYLAAEKRGEKVYTLLREALAKSGTAAIGLIVIRTRQHVCALLPVGKTLLLNTLRHADEVLAPEEHAPAAKTLEDARVSQREFGMAIKLVEDMRQKWDPENYHDTYRQDLLQRIDDKVKAGQTKTLTPASAKASEFRTAKVVDLSELLKRSLEQRGSKGAGGTRRTGSSSRADAASEPAAAPSRVRKAASGGAKRRRSA
ncbi:MAG TPA: Ku protein [Steroidobacteraceae bacterium]|nr:Ku protein [Steroidobacteraceae bacterium]